MQRKDVQPRQARDVPTSLLNHEVTVLRDAPGKS